MGLLDDPELQGLLQQLAVSEQQKRSAKMQALSQAGFAMMGTPKGREGLGLGRAGQIGSDVYQQGLLGAQQGNMQQFQLAQMLRKQREEEAQRKAMQQAYQGAVQQPVGPPSPDGSMPPQGFDMGQYAQRMMGINPKLGLDAFKEARESQPAPAAEKSPWAQINPKDFTIESLREFAATKDPSVLRPRVEAKPPESPIGKVSPDSFTPASLAKYAVSGSYADLVPIDKTPRTTVNIDNAPKLPAGYRWKDGMVGQQVEPIKDGPHDTSKKDAAARAGEVSQANIVLTKLDQAHDLVQTSAFPTTGFVGSKMANIPGTPAYNLKQLLEPVKANIGFDAINKMRQTSPTGGALGNVTVRELELLQSKIASLEQAQSQVQFLRALREVKDEYSKVVHGPQGGGGMPSPADIDAELRRRGLK